MALRGNIPPKDPMFDKFVVGITIVSLSALGLVFGAFALISRTTDSDSTTIVQTPDVATPVASHPIVAVTSPAPAVSQVVNPPAPAAVNSAQATGKIVTTHDLGNLAEAVNLYNGAAKNLDQTKWAAQLPVAQGLLQDCCDCGQRNWLNHFVDTANAAQSSPKDYFAAIQILDELPRNDAEEVGGTASN